MAIPEQSVASESAASQRSSLLSDVLGRRRALRRELFGLVFVLPAMAFFLVFSLYPMVGGLYYSLTRFTLLKPPVFIGLSNFVTLMGDANFIKAVRVTGLFVLGTTIPKWVLSLALAMVFRLEFRLKETYKVLYFTPALLSGVVISLVWRLLLNANGLVNAFLGPLVNKAEIFWLADSVLTPIAVMIVDNWAGIGYLMLIWLAGLVGIPREFYEAAAIDGANRWHCFWQITLPLLKPTTVFVVITSMVWAFQAFNLQFVITDKTGGPNGATTTVALLIYKSGFTFFKMGEAAAMSLMMFIVIIAITLVQIRLLRAEEVSYM